MEQVSIQLKSGQTVVSDMLGPPRRLAPRLESADSQVILRLVHGGEERRVLKGVDLLPWRSVAGAGW